MGQHRQELVLLAVTLLDLPVQPAVVKGDRRPPRHQPNQLVVGFRVPTGRAGQSRRHRPHRSATGEQGQHQPLSSAVGTIENFGLSAGYRPPQRLVDGLGRGPGRARRGRAALYIDGAPGRLLLAREAHGGQVRQPWYEQVEQITHEGRRIE